MITLSDSRLKLQCLIILTNFYRGVLTCQAQHTHLHTLTFLMSGQFKIAPSCLMQNARSFIQSQHSLQLLYLAKRARPDLLVAVSFLTKRVTHPQGDEKMKLVRAMQYLREASSMGIILSGGADTTVLAYVDSSHGVHHDMRSHTGCVIEIGNGPVYASSLGQKLNTKSRRRRSWWL